MGHLLRDQDIETIDRLVRDLDSYLAAARSGERKAWLRHHIGTETGLAADGDAVRELVTAHVMKRSLTAHECDGCGRLWVEHDVGSNQFLPYTPDGHAGRQLLTTESPVLFDLSDYVGWERAELGGSPPELDDTIRLFSLLELCLREGLGLVGALELCAREIPGRVGEAAKDACDELATGGSLFEAWSDSDLFSEATLESIRAGEEDGSLEGNVGELARRLRFDVAGVPACARFLERLATAVTAHWPDLAAALEDVRQALDGGGFRAFVEGLQESGAPIGITMERLPELFPPALARLVTGAEINGDLRRTLARAAEAVRLGLIG